MADYLKLENVSKAFGNQIILKNVTFSVDKKEVVSIIGPSGSGKTTLLRIIAGLETPDSGRTLCMTDNCRFGFVFQHFNLWPHMTVLGNVIEAPVLVKKMGKEKAIKEAKELLEKLDLWHVVNKYPLQLSGGERQRAAIARCLAMNPEIILLDEITSNLDPERIADINKIIKKLVNDGFTMVIVSHDFDFVNEISDKIIFLVEGEIIESGKPSDIFRTPSKDRTKEFISTILRKA